jgi:hypothetical protein
MSISTNPVNNPDPDSKEPVMGVAGVGTVVGVVLTALAAFGVVDITDAKVQAVAGVVLVLGPLVLGYLARRKAYSPATVARLLKAGKRG